MIDRTELDTLEFPLPLAGLDRKEEASSSRVRIDVGARTDTGSVRESNEDHYLVARTGRNVETLSSNIPPSDVPGQFSETGYLFILVAVLVAGAVAALVFIFADEAPAERMIIGLVVGTILSIYILLIGYVYADAKRRGMRHVLWTLVAAFVPNAIGVLAYFLLREPVLTPCGHCGVPARREFAFCPDCGATLHRACPACRRPVEPSWSHCAHCGEPLLGRAGASGVTASPEPESGLRAAETEE